MLDEYSTTQQLVDTAVLGEAQKRKQVVLQCARQGSNLRPEPDRVPGRADICPEWSVENLERLARALSDLSARLKIGEGSIDLLETEIDARMLRGLEIGTWRTSARDIDILMGIPGTSLTNLVAYPHLVAAATELQVGDLRILVASLDDIIRSKQISDRPKDREALRELRALRGP